MTRSLLESAVEARESPEAAHGHADTFKRRCAIAIMAITLAGGLLAWADVHALNRASVAEAHGDEALIETLGDQFDASQRLQVEQETENFAAQAAVLGAPAAHVDPVSVAQARADRAAATAAGSLTALGPSASAVFGEDTAARAFRRETSTSLDLANERQEAYDAEERGWRRRSSNLRAALTVLALAIFLVALAGIVPTSGARRTIVIAGAVVAVAGAAGGARAASTRVQAPSEEAIRAFVAGQARLSAAFEAAQTGRERRRVDALARQANALLSRAIALRPDYAKAYVNRAAAYLAQEGTPPRPILERALADLQRAIALGEHDFATYVNVAQVELSLRRYARAAADGMRAAELGPDVVPARFQASFYAAIAGVDPNGATARREALRRALADEPPAFAAQHRKKLARDVAEAIGADPRIAARACRWVAVALPRLSLTACRSAAPPTAPDPKGP